MKYIIGTLILVLFICTAHAVQLNEAAKYAFADNLETALILDDNMTNWSVWLDSRPLNLGYSDNYLVIKTTQIDSNNLPKSPILEIGYPRLDKILIYHYVDNILVDIQELGDSFEFKKRPLLHRNFLIRITNIDGIHSFVIIVKSDSSLVVPLKIVNETEYLLNDSVQIMFLMLFHGAMLIMAMYNLIIFFFSKEKLYLAYACYIIIASLAIASINGLTYQFLWSSSPTFQKLFSHLIIQSIAISILNFTKLFLSRDIKTSRFFNIMMLINFISMITTVFLPSANTILASMIILLLSGIIILYLIFKTLIENRATSIKIFTIGFCLPLVAGLASILEKLSVIPYSEHLDNFMYSTILLESLLLSIALVEHINALRKSNQTQELEILNSQLKSEKREKELLTSLNNKIQEAKITKDMAEMMVKQKSNFLATMSHELRTPMNAIIGMSDILATTQLTREQYRSVDIIKNSGAMLLGIISDILDLSKIEANQLELESINVNILLLIHECGTLFEPKVTNNVKSYIRISENVPRNMLADPIRLKQIIVNLLSNAFKFTKEGLVNIDIEYRDRYYYISVTDTGIGINDTSKLFKAFSQEDKSTTRKYGGTGLGLVISKKLAQMMGGDIYVKTEVNKGTTFTLKIPYIPSTNTLEDMFVTTDNVVCVSSNENFIESVKSCRIKNLKISSKIEYRDEVRYIIGPDILLDKPKQNMIIKYNPENEHIFVYHFPVSPYELECLLTNYEPVKQELKCFNELTILIAEDNTINQIVIEKMLQKLLVNYDIVKNGKEAIEKYKLKSYNLIIMDWEMPEMDGECATKELRKLSDSIPIIGLSAHAIDEIKECAKNAGMSDFINKPITLDKLKNILEKWK